MTFRALQTTFTDPDAFVDAFNDDPREGPDGEFSDDIANHCDGRGPHKFTTCCGVTRCLWCGEVVA
jgi:hypothetical protein